MKLSKYLQILILSIVIFLIWCWVYGRSSWSAWQIPLAYSGDGWLGLGFAKAFMDGDVSPVLYKAVAHLGAPFSANWNDYPLTEELIFALMGWLGRIIGIFPAENIIVFLAHILAGLSFFFVGKELKYRAEFVFSGAIIYAFSHFIFARSFGHIVLSYYWHLPLILLVCWWTYSAKKIEIGSREFNIAIVVSLVTGLLNPYYTWMFLQFLGFSILLHLVRRQYQLMKLPLMLVLVAAASFFMMNVDTISYAWLHGGNAQAIDRNLAALEVYGLKLPELAFPPPYHSWKNWAEYGQNHYFLPTFIKGEVGSPYLGLVGLIGFLWLVGVVFYRLLQGRPQAIPVHAWQVLWVLLFSLVGGINLLLGTFGIILFRGTNRYSIIILTLVLLFLVRQLSRKCPDKLAYPVAIFMVLLGLWDQLPPRTTSAQIQKMSDVVQSDRNFAKLLESKLSKGAMVFQLPVAPFPEMPPILKMADYEHFRPYLFTQNLHYSYGANKGRGDTDWQFWVSKSNPVDMIVSLEKYGFSTILINRKGYEDKAASLIAELSALGKEMIAKNEDLIAFKLNPQEIHEYPKSPPLFGVGWSDDEGSHRWAVSSRAEVKIINNRRDPKLVTLEFSLITLKPRIVDVVLNGKILKKVALDQGGAPVRSKFPLVSLLPGVNMLVMKTDVPPESPGGGDPRKLSFGISDMRIYDDNSEK